jgi:hypothetical protein
MIRSGFSDRGGCAAGLGCCFVMQLCDLFLTVHHPPAASSKSPSLLSLSTTD